MTIEVFADVWCPFTHVGLARFVQRRAAANVAAPLHLRAWPLELVNGEPMSFDHLAREVAAIQVGLDTRLFRGLERATFPSTTLPALRLTAAAYDLDLTTGETVGLELRDRLFERGEDVSDPGVLAEVAQAHGVELPPAPADDDRDPVVRDWREGKRRGVIGSPHFFTPAGGFFCPALDVQDVDGQLQVRPDTAGFEAFVRAALSRP